MNELALFAGAGGGILGGKLLGWRTVCAVEWEPYPASVLVARQNDGLLPPFPIWDDIQTFDGKPWRGIVDVVSGGFPCQDISAAGRGAGIDGERSGMWKHMARVVGEVRPRYVFVENSPMLVNRGLSRVLGDLSALGYDCRWTVMGAADVGANHQRDRMWIVGKVADTKKLFCDGGNHNSRISMERKEESEFRNDGWEKTLAYANSTHGERNQCAERTQAQHANFDGSGKLAHAKDQGNVWRQWIMGFAEQKNYSRGSSTNGRWQWWQFEPNVGRVADGMAARVDRLKAIGNGQVPLCAAEAWKLLTKD
jgi:DNA (cytosine-5)-methyltransferase 1